MAYPTFLTAPWVYRQNFHSTSPRQGQGPNAMVYGAASDGVATSLAALVAAVIAGQQTSLNKRLGKHNYDSAHPAGTRYSLNVLMRDANQRVWRQHLRNWNLANPGDYAVALFTGVVSADTLIVALSAPPSLPNSGQPCVTVSATPNALV